MTGGRLRDVARLAASREHRQDWLHERMRRLRGEPRLPAMDSGSILVVCRGNLCRSPLAAALLSRRAPHVEVRSAGLDANEGEPADPAASRCAERHGLSLAPHRTHGVTRDDVDWAELVLVMQGSQARSMLRRWPQARWKVFALGDFLPARPHQISDPWGKPDRVFDETFRRIDAAVQRLAGILQREPPRGSRRESAAG